MKHTSSVYGDYACVLMFQFYNTITYVLICCMYIFTIKTQRVNVYKNDDMTWDFTVQGEEALSCAY